MWKLMSMIKCYAVSNSGIERKFLNRVELEGERARGSAVWRMLSLGSTPCGTVIA